MNKYFMLICLFVFGLTMGKCNHCMSLIPLQEEAPHFIHYRCLQIESSLMRIQDNLDLIKEWFPESEDSILDIMKEIEIINYNIGYDYYVG